MKHAPTLSLGSSLFGARLAGRPEAAPSEAELLAYLRRCVRGGAADPAPGEIAGLLIGLKLGVPLVCTAPGGPPAVVAALAAALVGEADLLRLRGPLARDPVRARFEAVRITDFVIRALESEPATESRSSQPAPYGGSGAPALLLVEVAGDPQPTLAFLDQQIYQTLRTAGRLRAVNLFVIVTAPAGEYRWSRPWHMLQFSAPEYVGAQPPAPPALGYGRRLVAARLTPSDFRARLRTLQFHGGMAPKLLTRWLAASFDDEGRGLLVPDDAIANASSARALYWRLNGAVNGTAALAPPSRSHA